MASNSMSKASGTVNSPASWNLVVEVAAAGHFPGPLGSRRDRAIPITTWCSPSRPVSRCTPSGSHANSTVRVERWQLPRITSMRCAICGQLSREPAVSTRKSFKSGSGMRRCPPRSTCTSHSTQTLHDEAANLVASDILGVQSVRETRSLRPRQRSDLRKRRVGGATSPLRTRIELKIVSCAPRASPR
jgi:hypothetical protein